MTHVQNVKTLAAPNYGGKMNNNFNRERMTKVKPCYSVGIIWKGQYPGQVIIMKAYFSRSMLCSALNR